MVRKGTRTKQKSVFCPPTIHSLWWDAGLLVYSGPEREREKERQTLWFAILLYTLYTLKFFSTLAPLSSPVFSTWVEGILLVYLVLPLLFPCYLQIKYGSKNKQTLTNKPSDNLLGRKHKTQDSSVFHYEYEDGIISKHRESYSLTFTNSSSSRECVREEQDHEPPPS